MMRRNLIFILSLLCFVSLFGTGCGSSISKEEQEAIDCVLSLKRVLIDPGSLELHGDPIVVEDSDGRTYVFCDVGFKTAGGMKKSETLACSNGEIIGFISELKNGKSDFCNDSLLISFTVFKYTDAISGGELSGKITTVSGKKVAEEADIPYVKL